MCSLAIFGESNYIPDKCVSDKILLFWQTDEVNHLLNGMGALLVAANLNEVRLDAFQNPHPLITRTALKQALTEEVSITVCHQG